MVPRENFLRQLRKGKLTYFRHIMRKGDSCLEKVPLNERHRRKGRARTA